jgi:hypothetical protein
MSPVALSGNGQATLALTAPAASAAVSQQWMRVRQATQQALFDDTES